MKHFTVALLALLIVLDSQAQSFSKAEMLLENGLVPEAQKELIDLVFAPGSGQDKPKALNLLAAIAVDKNNLKAAIEAWNRLIRLFPNSPESNIAKSRLPLLTSILGQVAEENINDTVSRIYLRNADFWAKGRDRIFTIDSSFIPNTEAAIFWYDKVVADQPGTTAARIATEEKLRTLLGWKDPGQNGQSYGVKASPNTYLPVLEETFREYEKTFPAAGALQAFRFQIAQAYWQQRNWQKSQAWLNEIIGKDAGAQSFYKDLAERRLKNLGH